ncbi:DUF1289 domain-containing protein [Delftia sp. PS-11]|uniref:DUF1289 domain-containing protein n=1 Tax=Delftia sp. PS-11 TaxID=2767222 RepID=UPI002456CE74|nr:DUF1289 domain-containing protein [Delftia sp. PS-11]KAJ8743627.1 DUF1289 domain-containing protein [Delftia sp. PS-11]
MTDAKDLLAHKARAVFAVGATASGADASGADASGADALGATAEPVASPCISVCRMTPDRSHCQGCFRTIDEIRAWSKSDTPQRLAIWHALLERAGLAVPQE